MLMVPPLLEGRSLVLCIKSRRAWGGTLPVSKGRPLVDEAFDGIFAAAWRLIGPVELVPASPPPTMATT